MSSSSTVGMAALAALVALASCVAAVGLPLPGIMFYPLDPQVGNVAPSSDEGLGRLLRGRSALVVGGTDGIGRGVALAMAKAGASVTVVGHSRAKADAVVGNMTADARYPDEQHFAGFAVDLLTVKGCLSFTHDLRAAGRRFDYAVLSVGVWPDRVQPQTSDGVDKVIALDVLARYLITKEIQPLLKPGARVMSVLASTARVPPPPAVQTMKDIALGKKSDYWLPQILGTAGTLGDTWMQAASSKWPNVTFIGTFPGVVATDIVQTSKTFPQWLRPFLAAGQKLISMSVEESGKIHANILTSPNAAKRQVTYFNEKMEGRRTHNIAYDTEFGQWVLSFLDETVARHSPGNVREVRDGGASVLEV